MALSSRRAATRSTTTAAGGLLVLGFLASCGGNTSSPYGGNSSSSSQSTTTAGALVEPTTTTSQSTGGGGEVRLGCGTFCQNAGGYGGAGGHIPHPAVTVDTSQTVTVDPDGYVPVTVTCHLSMQCSGALIVGTVSGPSFGGRSDLLVDAGGTRTIGVPVGSSAIDLLRSNGPATMDVTTDASDSPGYVYQPGGLEAVGLDNLVTVVAPG